MDLCLHACFLGLDSIVILWQCLFSLKEEELYHISAFPPFVLYWCDPDAAFDVCELSTKFGKVTYHDLHKANKVVIRLKYEQFSLKYSFKCDLKEAKLLKICDASFANLPNDGSQGRIIVFVGDGNENALSLSWSFGRLKRVVKAHAAGTLILVEAAETSF